MSQKVKNLVYEATRISQGAAWSGKERPARPWSWSASLRVGGGRDAARRRQNLSTGVPSPQVVVRLAAGGRRTRRCKASSKLEHWGSFAPGRGPPRCGWAADATLQGVVKT